ncbi:hypothetical protein QVA66_10620 [Staphylococcus chromogenes]|nr:hypothetical protein [Staphylococcus chromogenes]
MSQTTAVAIEAEPVETSVRAAASIGQTDARGGVLNHGLVTPLNSNGFENSADSVSIQPYGAPAIAVAAIAWCAKGALAGVSSQVLLDAINGEWSSFPDYAKSALVSCIVGDIGGVVWRGIPQRVKNEIFGAILDFYIKYIPKD